MLKSFIPAALLLLSFLHTLAAAPTKQDFVQITSVDELTDGMTVYIYSKIPNGDDETTMVSYLTRAKSFRFGSLEANTPLPLTLQNLTRGYVLFNGDSPKNFLQFQSNGEKVVIKTLKDDDAEFYESYLERPNCSIDFFFRIDFSDDGQLILSPNYSPYPRTYAATNDNGESYWLVAEQEMDPPFMYYPIYLASGIVTKLQNKPVVKADVNGDGDFSDIEITCDEGCEILYALRAVQTGLPAKAAAAKDYNWKQWSNDNWAADYKDLTGQHVLMVKARQGDIESDVHEVGITGGALTVCETLSSDKSASTSYFTLQGIPVSESNMQSGEYYIARTQSGAYVLRK